ncbi:hypothetical protein [Cellulomonas sp. P5_C5]
MELTVRLTTEAVPGSIAGGYAIGAVCGAVFLGIGVAHYAGVGKSMAGFWLFTTTNVLALAWLGAGVLVGVASVAVLDGDGTVRTVLGLLLSFAAVTSWLVGVVGIFWLPRRLRPRWHRESHPPRRKARR